MSGAHGGRTNDLIRRFESLALKQQGSGAIPQKADRPVRISPAAVTQQSPSRPALAPVLEDQAVTFPELAQTPPHRPVGDLHRSDQLRPNLQAGGLSISPLSPHSLPLTRPPPADDGLALRTSTGRKRSLVTDLNKRAQIDRSISASVKAWLKTAQHCMEEAKADKRNGELENAYVKYMKSSTIITEIVPKQKEFDRRDSVYVRLRGELGRSVLNELEELAAVLKQRPYPERSMTAEQVDEMEDAFANKFPEHPGEPWTTPPVQPVSYNSASTIEDVLYNEHNSRFREIDAQARMVDMSGPQTGMAAVQGSGGAAAEWVGKNMVTCTPTELWDLIQKSRVSTGGRPSVLILDVRMHQEFAWGHIDHRTVVNVDPLGLHAGCTSRDIEKSLVLVSEEQQEWFRRRNEFDIVVYMDQNSRNSNTKGLRELVAAIYHYEVDKTLKHSPLLLIGGMDAWEAEVGRDKCLWSNTAAKKAPNIASMLSYHAPTGALTNTQAQKYTPGPQKYTAEPQQQQQSVDLYRYQPMPMQPAVGSVFDFFQQNANYRPQWPAVYTQGYNTQGLESADQIAAPKPLPEIPGAAARVQRRKTVFDNPVYGFTGSPGSGGERQAIKQQAQIQVSQPPSIPPKPAAYQQKAEAEGYTQKEEPSPQKPELSPPKVEPSPTKTEPSPQTTAAVVKRRHTPPAAPLPAVPRPSTLYANPTAAGSDPSLNGRMHAGGLIRSQAVVATSSQKTEEDAGGFGSTGLKNFGNTCFMNSIIQCLAGTTPFVRYFRQGHWRRTAGGSDVAVEFARLVDTMWSGQYASLSPVAFRNAVGRQSEQFRGNDQEDAQEFAVFLLDALHEALNTISPRPPPDRELSAEDEQVFEQLVDARQAQFMWERHIRRNWSIVTSIFQGQAQSRLTCLTCRHTSTTYATFTELSVPIPGGTPSTDIYKCLDAYSETEVLDGDDRWKCPQCKAKRRATKRLLIARLPLVLIVHLKRFSTIGHFREKLETRVSFPTRHLQVGNYTAPGTAGKAEYNLYAVANHFGTLSGGHYTASVFNGLRQNWSYYDDTRVSPIREQDVATPAAYLLFYVRAD
ncbi:cysteine proteinase [Linderina pennispora]|uniref:ubiquitinyl hydrolase 1 n=1 Tax=Linderina pennispora TaxID=61395 RepID=A0A1Y1W9W6_9FUNG|nr:cysteine proteinase [Linderina pennispora]ORX70337.1 cysteine proteinase [Linderina pennispora]